MSPTTQAPETAALAPVRATEVSIDILKYKEELAAKMGLPSPYAMGLMKELSVDLVASGMVPKHFQNNPMGVYAAALRGREMELEPMESIMETFWSAPGGNLGMYAKKMLQIMHRGGVTSEFLKEDHESCEILFTPPAPHKPYTAKFHVSEAQQAGLVKPDSNWMKWRTDMNRARAISRGYRALMGTFGKLSTFGGYSKEEIEDSGVIDSTMGDPSAADAVRADVLQAKYHVGVKETAQAHPEPTQAVPGSDKDNVTGPPPQEKAPAPAPQAAPPAPRAEVKPKAKTNNIPAPAAPPIPNGKFAIYYLNREGGVERMNSEEPETLRESATLRAQALCNESGNTFYVYEEIDGVKMAGPPVFTAAKQQAAPQAAPAPDPAPAPAAPAPPAGTSPLRQRLIDISGVVHKVVNEGLAEDKQFPEKTVAARVKTFLLGYFGIAKLADLPKDEPANAESYEHAFSDLESCARQDANVLFSAPEDAGKRMAANTIRLAGMLAGELKWHPDNIALAFKLARLRNMEHSDLMTFLQNGALVKQEANGWKSIPVDDISAALRLCLITRQAGRFIRECNAHNMSIAESLKWMEERKLWQKKAEECSAADVEKAIDWAMKAIEEKANEKARKEAPAVAPPRREADRDPQAAPAAVDDDLFTELP